MVRRGGSDGGAYMVHCFETGQQTWSPFEKDAHRFERLHLAQAARGVGDSIYQYLGGVRTKVE